jgi:hypothetical protein
VIAATDSSWNLRGITSGISKIGNTVTTSKTISYKFTARSKAAEGWTMQYIVSRHLLKVSSQVHLGIKTPQFRPVNRQVATSPWKKGAERVEVE